MGQRGIQCFLNWLKSTDKKEYITVVTGFKMWQDGRLKEEEIYKFKELLRLNIVKWEISQYAKVK